MATPAVAPQPTIIFSDSHFVIASNGAIVLIGDDADLRANTGDASSGTVAIDVSDSTLTSNGPATAPRPSAPAGSSALAATQVAQSSYRPLLVGQTASGRAASIAGYEDHSVSVVGNDQIILYDDSNVIIGRNGTVNANTGDTDSSGLNVVDATNSIVRSGNSGDGEGGGEDSDDDADDIEDEEDVEDVEKDDDVVADDDVLDTEMDPVVGGPDTAVTTAGAAPAVAAPAASASVDDEDVSTSATGDDVTVIGGDGFDDLAIRSTGDRNIIAYDDSNLVIGGTGPANLQIGDSDTGGAVVMGVHNSIIEAGCEGDLCPLYDSPAPAPAMEAVEP